MQELISGATVDSGTVFAGQWFLDSKPPKNVWMGTSVENQLVADTRIPALLKIPAGIHFLSMEPLLSDVNIFRHLCDGCDQCERPMPRHIGGCFNPSDGDDDCDGRRIVRPKVDWVIAGGESGPHARHCHHWWAEFLQRQCQAAGVPFFWKQWGEWIPAEETLRKDPIAEMDLYHAPDGTRTVGDGQGYGTECWRLGKDKAGRRLFGREYNEIPTLEVTK